MDEVDEVVDDGVPRLVGISYLVSIRVLRGLIGLRAGIDFFGAVI